VRSDFSIQQNRTLSAASITVGVGRRGVLAAPLLASFAAKMALSAPSAMVVDAAVLRTYGAKLDGEADDLPAINAILAEARKRAPASIIPSVLFDFPAGTVALSGPPQTGFCHVTIRGAGQTVTKLLMKAGGSGIWQHGSAQSPALGYFQAEDISFVDGNANGSGCIGLSFRFAAEAPQSCMTWQGIALRKWTRPAQIVNCPRNWHCENVTVFGPDFTMQDAAGFDIASTVDFSQGCFTYVFINVLIANYAWGWRYDIQAPLEGQRFYSCTCYNGWGMVQAHCHGGAGPGQAGETYKSLLWFLVDCDWQGLGYGLDLVNLRNVVVDSGFFISNPSNDALAIPPMPGTTKPRPRRRYFSFAGCEDVVLRDLEFDVMQAGIEPSLALVFVDAESTLFRAYDTNVYSLSTIFAGFEFAAPDQASHTPATMAEFDTKWEAWTGGVKVRDAGGNQINQSDLRDRGLGDVDARGRTSLEIETEVLKADSSGLVRIAFPRRAGGGSFFLNGPPIVTATAVGAEGIGVIEKSADGFVVSGPGLRAGMAVRVDYRAVGF
jgi:hypothetical protein